MPKVTQYFEYLTINKIPTLKATLTCRKTTKYPIFKQVNNENFGNLMQFLFQKYFTNIRYIYILIISLFQYFWFTTCVIWTFESLNFHLKKGNLVDMRNIGSIFIINEWYDELSISNECADWCLPLRCIRHDQNSDLIGLILDWLDKSQNHQSQYFSKGILKY